MTVADKLRKAGPHTLLALDGGGVRGILAVETLAAIEALLQRELGRDDNFVLADYFDYIGGTSTGAMIAAALALGMRVDRVRRFYLDGGREIFARAGWNRRLLYKFRNDRLARLLRREIGSDTTLGSDRLRTLLMLVMRNATTNSPWCLSNNPAAKFNRVDTGEASNLDLPLWQLVRASTAAPTFFAPEVIRTGERSHVFVDGAITMFNNPAFQLFLMATAAPYQLHWPTGTDAMLLVSVGTGTHVAADEGLTPRQMNLLYHASTVPAALMSAAKHEQDFLCRVFGDCRFGDALDGEVGDLHGARGPVEPKLFTYLRYDATLTRAGLDALGLPGVRPEHIQPIDAVAHVHEMRRVGEAFARQVSREHFAGFLQ